MYQRVLMYQKEKILQDPDRSSYRGTSFREIVDGSRTNKTHKQYINGASMTAVYYT